MNEEISNTLNKIRSYTKAHAELQKSHHICFNCPLGDKSAKTKVVVLGLNPGECRQDYEKIDTNLPTEETHEYDFHDDLGDGRKNLKWTQLCEEFCPNSNIFQSEFFFWSSHKTGSKFTKRFGYSFRKCPHLDFCKECNIELFELHQPKLILATGTTHAHFFSKMYQLKYIGKQDDKFKNGKNKTIIIHYEWQNIPFIFTRHWTGAFGFSNKEKETIITYLDKYL